MNQSGKIALGLIIGSVIGFCVLTGIGLCAGHPPAPIAEIPAAAPIEPAATDAGQALDDYGPAPGQSPRAFIRDQLYAQIADGRSMEDVRRRAFGGGARIDYDAISEKVDRQNAHFAASNRLRDYVRAVLPDLYSQTSEMTNELLGDEDPTAAEEERVYQDPRVRALEGMHAWVFDSFRAIEFARLCGDGEDHAHARRHCVDAEEAIEALDRETREEYGPFAD